MSPEGVSGCRAAEDNAATEWAVLAGSPFAGRAKRHSKIGRSPNRSAPRGHCLCVCAVPSRRPSARGSLVALPLLVVLACVGRAAGWPPAQTPFVPYFGKNNIHYDKFEWHIYKTDHFEIYYYPELEQHLERIAGYAESAYQQVSADLKHDLSFKMPLDPVQDAQRVRAAERRARRRAGRRRRLRRAVSRSAWCCRSTIRRTCSTA